MKLTAWWVRNDMQGDIRLTDDSEAHLPLAELKRIALEFAERMGLSMDDGHIFIESEVQ